MGTKGYDSFFPDPGTVDEIECKVCGTVCDAQRGVSGPTSFAGAMAGSKRLHDYFSCPHCETNWHKQALAICIAQHDCPSPTLKQMMQDDINEIVKSKEVWT